MQITKLCLGSDCINLTHVAASVLLSNVRYVQEPGAMLVMGHTDTRVASDHVIVDGQNS